MTEPRFPGMLPGMDKALVEMLIGHILFIASGVAYTIHWVLHFKKPGPLATVLIAASLVTGLAGVVLLSLSLFPKGAVTGVESYGLWPVPLACSAVFLTVLLFTSIVLKRRFTSELPLLLIWMCLEVSAFIVASRLQFLSPIPLGICALLAALAALLGLLCYSVYYLLAGKAQFIDGLIPYVAISLSMAVTTISLVLGI